MPLLRALTRSRLAACARYFNGVTAAVLVALALAAPLPALAATAGTPDAITADGGRYFGPLVNGKLQGQGRLEWANGKVFVGGFDQGVFSGTGRWESGYGDVYEGDYVAGMRSGNGRLVTRGGAVYVGAFKLDEFDGQGRYELPDGSVYVGDFEHGMFSGRGTLTRFDEAYEGEFRLGEPWGQGELAYADGRKYRGSFERGRLQGTGRYVIADTVYEGAFVMDEFTGRGSYRRGDGSRHEGEFLKWVPHGPGTFTDPQGAVYTGNFVKGELNGAGKVTFADGSRYEGDFLRWLPHGKGEMHLRNGDVYTGSFALGEYDGTGTLVFAKAAPDGHTQDSGEWRHGKLRQAELRERAVIQAGVETALYRQRAALDQALATLAPRDPSKINLFLLAVAGDGTQEVFRREVDFVRDQFDRRFGTRGHSLALVNSRFTGPEVPLATTTSIGAALAAIAARMDKERDILFLFLTSHGSRTHELSLEQRGLDLPDLGAQRLGTLLRESGIRWKVVVISACYAGGFIDAVKDERTLVITAARADRRSFGCADENEFTDFGRAYFKDALPQSRSFQDAFRRAETLVGQWEAAGRAAQPAAAAPADAADAASKFEPSLPQMVNPPAIEQYLRRWWDQTARTGPLS